MPMESSQNETIPIEDNFTVKTYKPQEKTIYHDPEKMQQGLVNHRTSLGKNDVCNVLYKAVYGCHMDQ